MIPCRRPQPTRNRTGWTATSPNELSQAFINFAATADGPLLDLGAAYGVATLPALAMGATLIANDLDAAHLEVLAERTPEEQRPRLTLLPGRFPRDTALPNGLLAGIHASNLFHFLTGPQLRTGVKQMRRWLRPGGQVFVQAATPFQAPFAAFIPEFLQRVEGQVEWPGFVENARTISTHGKLGQIPKSLHLMSPDVLTREFSREGFTIVEALYYRPKQLSKTLHHDGRESVRFMARLESETTAI